jgi:phage terminase large subunit-like protein
MSYETRLRDLAERNDAAFAEYLSEGAIVFPLHLREASAFADRHDKGLVLEPRGHAKTTLFMARTARRIGEYGGRRRIGILTAVSKEAEMRSASVRRMVESARFGEVFPWARHGVVGTPWTDAAWTVRAVDLGKDHTLTAIGLQAARAGARLDDLLADDVVGNQENGTAAMRDKARETYLSVVDPMLVPGGTRWFLGTRWHEDDLYAELIGAGWPHLVRQAIDGEGNALWPEYWSLERLEDQRRELGSAIFDLQYQNDPRGMGGNIFKREWFRYVNDVPAGSRQLGMDLAASSKERSDYTAVIEWIEDADHNLYLVGAFRARLDGGHRRWLTGVGDDEALDRTQTTGPRLLWPTNLLPPGFAGISAPNGAARPISALNIETTQFQSTFRYEVLARTRLPAMAVYPDKDKVTRGRTLAARYEAGKVFHLRGGVGLAAYEAEAVAFPNAEHDDLVDAAVYGAALNQASEFYFARSKWAWWAP